MQRYQASGHLNDGLHDGALGGDGLGICLVVTLGLDQLDQFVGQVDVGLFQRVGHDRTQGAGLRRIDPSHARREGFFPAGPANWLQALLVGEAGDPKNEIGKEFIPCRTEVICKLIEIWTAVLNVESIAIHDNFFDLGGDSLTAAQLASRVRL